VFSALVAAGVLLALALPYTDLERGTAGVESLPDGRVKQAYQLLQRDFAAGLAEPLEIVVDARRSPESEAALDRLIAELGLDDAFGPVTARRWNDAGTLAVVEVPPTIDGNSPAAYEAVERLRDELIPRAFTG
jgi:putative drug exporter of the RND superfamily